MPHFLKETRIAATPAEVFAFHERPEALETLTPPWESMRVETTDHSLAPGSRVVLRGRVGPVPVRWVAVHTVLEPPHLFVDVQESGPFAKWVHRHEFLDDGKGGTLLRDDVDYEVPLGFLGRWFGGWFVRRKLARMFEYRHDVTRRMIESPRP